MFTFEVEKLCKHKTNVILPPAWSRRYAQITPCRHKPPSQGGLWEGQVVVSALISRPGLSLSFPTWKNMQCIVSSLSPVLLVLVLLFSSLSFSFSSSLFSSLFSSLSLLLSFLYSLTIFPTLYPGILPGTLEESPSFTYFLFFFPPLSLLFCLVHL